MRNKLTLLCLIVLGCLSLLGFAPMAQQPLTFTMLRQDPEATMEKYAAYWADTTITQSAEPAAAYRNGDVVGTITIPKMDYYEMPIYYGSDTVNTNWQITTAGYLGNWDMFGEPGRAVVGAHNYQLFTQLPVLEPGDRFLIETEQDIFVYEVTGHTVFDHETDDWTQVAYESAEPYSVDLMTCYPIEPGAATDGDMYIVYSRMVRGTQFS